MDASWYGGKQNTAHPAWYCGRIRLTYNYSHQCYCGLENQESTGATSAKVTAKCDCHNASRYQRNVHCHSGEMQAYLSTHTDLISPRLSLDKTPTKSGASGVSSSMPSEGAPYSIVSKCAAEFFALMAFVLVGSLQAVTTYDGVLHAAFCHGIAIVVLVAIFAHISGGHVNPAVTLGVAVAGKMPPIEAIFYVVAQLLGGLLGSFIVRAILNFNQYVTIQGGATLCGVGVAWYQGLIAEIFTTSFLVLAVLLSAADEKSVIAPIVIGFTVLFDIIAVGSISGASMNPARSFGPNVVASIFISDQLIERFWSQHWIYYAGPIIGALMAAGLYRVFFARENRLVK
ncbi:unnamed protein product [Cylicocyclus nassatus]|uniref:Aquaporin n=1 Tax=Cylicocyclus nassatus TaxID=53992 RepID=A0AA36DPP4_CYLNA|nr:unnamed protein product [Cylicocyclus nassatus]